MNAETSIKYTYKQTNIVDYKINAYRQVFMYSIIIIYFGETVRYHPYTQYRHTNTQEFM